MPAIGLGRASRKYHSTCCSWRTAKGNQLIINWRCVRACVCVHVCVHAVETVRSALCTDGRGGQQGGLTVGGSCMCECVWVNKSRLDEPFLQRYAGAATCGSLPSILTCAFLAAREGRGCVRAFRPHVVHASMAYGDPRPCSHANVMVHMRRLAFMNANEQHIRIFKIVRTV
eukprot:356395-Chlamydomonas_euryale.AAC.3